MEAYAHLPAPHPLRAVPSNFCRLPIFAPVIIFSRNLGISIRRFDLPSTIADSSRVREKGRTYPSEALGAELRGGDPFAMQVTRRTQAHRPRRYLPGSGRLLPPYVWDVRERATRLHARGSEACGGRCTCRQTGETYLPCTIARLHISRDAQHVITRAESKKTIASRPANRRSRANESEPTRPMAGPGRAPGEPGCNPRGDAAEPETRGVVRARSIRNPPLFLRSESRPS